MSNSKPETSGTVTHSGFRCRNSKSELSPRAARRVLDCGSPLPLSLRDGFSIVTQSAKGLAHSKPWRTVALGLLLSSFILHPSSFAQSFSIPWHTIVGGGGTSTGGVYSVTGTIGQPDAGGPMTNGQFSLTGGFWSLPQAVQTEGAPTLTIAKGAPGFALISWTPATGTNWVLQERASLTSGSWSNSPSGPTNPVTVPATVPAKFYRLFKP